MNKFQTGKTYSCRSICDHETIFEYKVIRRTEKSIWVDHWDGGVRRVKIQTNDDGEFAYPDGRYSMCPVIRA